MNNVVVVSYAGSLLLLFFCVMLLAQSRRSDGGPYAMLMLVFGMLPGLAGVVYGFYLFMALQDRTQGLAVMTAWLLLEMGALQLQRLAVQSR